MRKSSGRDMTCTSVFRPRDRVVQHVPRLMEPRAGEVSVDLIPRYARVICVFEEMRALSVRWEDTGEHEIVKRSAVFPAPAHK